MFCKYCGTQVPDGYVCNCPEAQAARAAESAPVATAAPAAGAGVGKMIGDAFKALPASAKTLLGNAEGPGTNVVTAGIYAVGSLILNILSWVLIVAGLLGSLANSIPFGGSEVKEYINTLFEGIYGYAVLGGLWTCIVPIALSMVIIIVGQLIRKEKVDIIPAFITASCINVAPSLIFLVGALFSTFLGAVGAFLILVGVIVYLAANYKLIGKFVANTTGVVGGLIAAAIIAAVTCIMILIIYGVIKGYVEGPLAETLSGGITDLLGSLVGGGSSLF